LSNEGLKHWLDVLSIIFRYIDLVRVSGVEKWVFDEVRKAKLFKYD
jgi:secreted Zn-dependent insulinase-like peptidase